MINITSTASYMGLDSWVLANILQLATFDFCRRFLNRNNDPAGRMFDQMTQAARSIQANISEGCSRQQTSTETEMKLLDVARASASELAGDYLFIIMARGETAWRQEEPLWKEIHNLKLDKPNYGNDFMHDATEHIITQRKRFAPWIDNENVSVAANSLLIICIRVIHMLRNQIKNRFEDFKKEGGFAENLTRARLESRTQQQDELPTCPKCGGKMIKRVTQRGSRQGREFWGCCNYPKCDGIRDI